MTDWKDVSADNKSTQQLSQIGEPLLPLSKKTRGKQGPAKKTPPSTPVPFLPPTPPVLTPTLSDAAVRKAFDSPRKAGSNHTSPKTSSFFESREEKKKEEPKDNAAAFGVISELYNSYFLPPLCDKHKEKKRFFTPAEYDPCLAECRRLQGLCSTRDPIKVVKTGYIMALGGLETASGIMGAPVPQFREKMTKVLDSPTGDSVMRELFIKYEYLRNMALAGHSPELTLFVLTSAVFADCLNSPPVQTHTPPPQ